MKKKVEPPQVARQLGRHVVRQNLGDMRSFASQAAHSCTEIDEEKFFEEVSEAFLKGVKQEVAKIFGATKASRMLDPFKR